MLVLTIKAGESVCCDGPVVIKVLNSKNGRVSLGFIAPKATHIAREKLWSNKLRRLIAKATKWDVECCE